MKILYKGKILTGIYVGDKVIFPNTDLALSETTTIFCIKKEAVYSNTSLCNGLKQIAWANIQCVGIYPEEPVFFTYTCHHIMCLK
jgi:hypothetical protein